MNPSIMMKLLAAWGQFQNNHPKVVSYFNTVAANRLEEGTVIEISIKRPDDEAKVCNMRVTQADLDLIDSLKDLAQNPQ